MSFLGNRKMFAEILGIERSFASSQGIPQGGSSACKVWNLCADKLIKQLKSILAIVIIMYSDDLHVQLTSEYEAITQNRMKRTLEITDNWCEEFGLKLQIEKCSFMRFHKHRDEKKALKNEDNY